MNKKDIREAASILPLIENYLKEQFSQNAPDKLWENNFIKRQIEKRKQGEPFTLQDHIRAMVYSMLSSAAAWNRVASETNERGEIIKIDTIFFDYDVDKLKTASPEQLCEKIRQIKCRTPYIRNKMKALLENINQFVSWEQKYGSIDTYYKKLIEIDRSMKTLISLLSAAESIAKLEQMYVALVCEYLRNIGYDIPKPDRHIRRILGSDYLAFSNKKDVPAFEAFDLIMKLAELTGKSPAEADYILWAYCANGYGEICTKKNAKCEICVAGRHCNQYTKSNTQRKERIQICN